MAASAKPAWGPGGERGVTITCPEPSSISRIRLISAIGNGPCAAIFGQGAPKTTWLMQNGRTFRRLFRFEQLPYHPHDDPLANRALLLPREFRLPAAVAGNRIEHDSAGPFDQLRQRRYLVFSQQPSQCFGVQIISGVIAHRFHSLEVRPA